MNETPLIVGPDGKPRVKAKPDTRCPRCGASEEFRQDAGVFGPVQHDVCIKCGYDYPPEGAR